MLPLSYRCYNYSALLLSCVTDLLVNYVTAYLTNITDIGGFWILAILAVNA